MFVHFLPALQRTSFLCLAEQELASQGRARLPALQGRARLPALQGRTYLSAYVVLVYTETAGLLGTAP